MGGTKNVVWGTKCEDLLRVWESQQKLVGLGDGVMFPKQIENSPTKNPNKSNCVSMCKYQFISSVNKLEGQKRIFEVFYFDFNLRMRSQQEPSRGQHCQ